MLIKILKRRVKKLLCYTSVFSLVLSMAGKVYGQDNPYYGVRVNQVSVGGSHIATLDEEGNVWTWGNNFYGQLGDGTKEYTSKPVAVSKETGLGKVTQIVAGYSHTIALDEEGNVWTWGSNSNGQLGDRTSGIAESKSKPVSVSKETGLGKVIKIAASGDYTIAIDEERNVWAWGNNYYGYLGDGASGEGSQRNEPVPVSKETGLEKAIDIATGFGHTVAIDEAGDVWTWGSNFAGQLGDGTIGAVERKNKPVPVSKDTGLEKVTQVAAGFAHTVALDEEGNVWTWGSNDYGELGDGNFGDDADRSKPVNISERTGLEKIIQIEAGLYHTVALDEEGNVWTWGNNASSQLGDGTNVNRSEPVAVSKETGLGKVEQIAAGGYNILALDNNGIVWSWGYNYDGQLGDGSNLTSDLKSNVPVQSLIYTRPIELIPDTFENDADHDIEISFLSNRTFKNHISGVKVDGTLLEEGDYTVEDGKIILHQSETNPILRKAGNVDITVNAEYYPDSSVLQTIHHGATDHLHIAQDITQPLANKEPFDEQPVIHILDKYDNL